MPYTEKELKDLAAWWEGIQQNPEARDKVYEAMEIVNPEVNIPDRKIKKELAKVKDETRDIEKKVKELLEKKEWEAYIEKNRVQLKDEGYTDDEVAKIEQLMRDKGLKDYEIAQSHFDKKMRQVAEPTYSMNSAPEVPLIDRDYVKKVTENPEYANFYGHQVFEEEKAKRLAAEKKRYR